MPKKDNKFQQIASNPNHQDVILSIDGGRILVVENAYKKSDHHLLIIPRKPIRWPSNLKTEDIELVQDMRHVAQWLAGRFLLKNPGNAVRIGFHSVASMPQVHLHSISLDCATTNKKKIYNKTVTSFFVDADTAIKDLKQHGSLKLITSRGMLDETPLSCFKCGTEFQEDTLAKGEEDRLVEFKKHLNTCTHDYPDWMKNESLVLPWSSSPIDCRFSVEENKYHSSCSSSRKHRGGGSGFRGSGGRWGHHGGFLSRGESSSGNDSRRKNKRGRDWDDDESHFCTKK